MTQTLQAGPLLAHLIAAQALEEEVTRYPRIQAVADALIAHADEVGRCAVWPVGSAAERVAGAAITRSRGRIDVACWTEAVTERRLLLFSVAAVSPLSMAVTASQLRRRGAAEVHGCAVAVAGAADAEWFDSFAVIGGVAASKTPPRSSDVAA